MTDNQRSTNEPGVDPLQGDPDGLDLSALAGFLGPHLTTPLAGPLQSELISGGKSNLTYRVTDGQCRWILRRPPLGDFPRGAHDVVREHRVMSALRDGPVPVPTMTALCEDGTVLGAPFYVMDEVPGTVLRTASQVAALDERTRRRLGDAVVDTLADLHEVDVAEVGLAKLGRPDGFLSRQVDRWGRQYERVQVRDLGDVGGVAARLLDTVPAHGGAGIVHGDYRLDNCLVSPDDVGSLAAVLDWEMATVGDPLADLGMLLMYWDEADAPYNPISAGLTAAAGFPSREQVLERYVSRRGIEVDHLDWYVAFSEFKLAIILEQIHARTLRGQTRGDGFSGVGDMVPGLLSSVRTRMGGWTSHANRGSATPDGAIVNTTSPASTRHVPATQWETLSLKRIGRVALITLNRPESRNALNSATIRALREAISLADTDKGVGAIVLTGAGPAFCAGLDLKELGSGGDLLEMGAEQMSDESNSPWGPTAKPVIGAINGPAVTGGFELALNCDFLIASETASFADTHAHVGVLPGWGLSVLLPALVGRGMARRMSLTGDYLDAQAALRWGLVTEVVAPNDLVSRALGVAAIIAGNDPAIVGAYRSSYVEQETLLLGLGYAVETRVSDNWAASAFRAEDVAARREAIIDRGRSQTQDSTSRRRRRDPGAPPPATTAATVRADRGVRHTHHSSERYLNQPEETP